MCLELLADQALFLLVVPQTLIINLKFLLWLLTKVGKLEQQIEASWVDTCSWLDAGQVHAFQARQSRKGLWAFTGIITPKEDGWRYWVGCTNRWTELCSASEYADTSDWHDIACYIVTIMMWCGCSIDAWRAGIRTYAEQTVICATFFFSSCGR